MSRLKKVCTGCSCTLKRLQALHSKNGTQKSSKMS
nr:MAG TPA: hypothetical protein [Caudoviricetes sp.]